MICVHLLPSVPICVEEQAQKTPPAAWRRNGEFGIVNSEIQQAQKTPLWITAGVLKVEVGRKAASSS